MQEIAERLRSSKGLLQLWQRYKDCYQQCSSTVRLREDQTNELLKTATSKDIADDEVTTWIQDCNVCLLKLYAFSHLCELKVKTVTKQCSWCIGSLHTKLFPFAEGSHICKRDNFTSTTQISIPCCFVVSESFLKSSLWRRWINSITYLVLIPTYQKVFCFSSLPNPLSFFYCSQKHRSLCLYFH